MSKKARYRMMVVTRLGTARQVYLIPHRGFSYRRGNTGRAQMTAPQIEAAKRWARRRLVRSTKIVGRGGWPFLELVPGARWPTNKKLLRSLNTVARLRKRRIRIVSGLRTPHEAWQLRMKFLSGRGNLAARCCTRYSGPHSWANCGKDPWSNHADGNAADCGTLTGNGRYTSLADDGRARSLAHRHGLIFPVTSPWEPWHAEHR